MFLRATVLALAAGTTALQPIATTAFDHSYKAYGVLLASIVHGATVDYTLLAARRHDVRQIAGQFEVVSGPIDRWSRHEQMAFWINAYNVFTLKAVADRYPIRGIRQIDGVWTDLRFPVASAKLSLDDIEHRILRPTFKDPRVHFAINCASVSCPPLRAEPYVAPRLDAQLEDAAKRYLASPLGLRMKFAVIYVSSIFKWYGDDFIPAFAGRMGGPQPAKERAILGVVATYGPADAQRAARSPHARVRFLRYDWSLNDSAR